MIGIIMFGLLTTMTLVMFIVGVVKDVGFTVLGGMLLTLISGYLMASLIQDYITSLAIPAL